MTPERKVAPLPGWTAGNTFHILEDSQTGPRLDPIRDIRLAGDARHYQPLDRENLWRDFAKLGNDVLSEPPVRPVTPPSKRLLREVVDFANKYGPPWLPPWPESDHPGKWPTVLQVRLEAQTLRLAWAILENWPDVSVDLVNPFVDLDNEDPLIWVENRFISRIHDVSIFPVFGFRKPERIGMAYAFRSLLGPIWLQFREYVVALGSEGAVASWIRPQCAFRNCRLIVSDPKRGRRYCSEACRQAEKKARQRDRKKGERR